MRTHSNKALLFGAFLISACSIFDTTSVRVIDDPANTAATRVKFHNFSPSSVGVDFIANNAKVTGVSSTRCSPALPAVPAAADTAACRATGIEATTGTAYGGLGASGLYQGVASGSTILAAKMAAKDTIIATITQSLDVGKYYSFFLSGIYNTTTKTADAFVVEDPIPTAAIDYTVAHVRFVNAISNATASLDLIGTSTVAPITSTTVGSAIAYKAAGAFITLPEGTYDFVVRNTGTTTNVFAPRTGVSLVGGRVYTLTARGSTATASTLALDFTSNQR